MCVCEGGLGGMDVHMVRVGSCMVNVHVCMRWGVTGLNVAELEGWARVSGE